MCSLCAFTDEQEISTRTNNKFPNWNDSSLKEMGLKERPAPEWLKVTIVQMCEFFGKLFGVSNCVSGA